MENIVAIIPNRDIKIVDFNFYFLPLIEKEMENPNTKFIFSDMHSFIARYMNNRRYRNCVIYHIGNTPKHQVGNYKTKGGFASYDEIYYTLKDDATKELV